jgi:SAM-dependent methyltransferase
VSVVRNTPIIRLAQGKSTGQPKQSNVPAENAACSRARGGDFSLIEPYLPERDTRQTWSLIEATNIVQERTTATGSCNILDLGCGAGESFGPLTGSDPRITWIGLDISDSMEVRNRGKLLQSACTYDGANIPMKSNSFDVVYTRQVFEHVRHPEKLLGEVIRILRPGSVLIGSTSHLEPYHSRSYWNFTPYGFSILLEAAGFRDIRVRPGIDGFTLIGRRLFSYLKMAWLFEPFFRRASPLNTGIELLRLCRVPEARRNALKLTFCGHFIFQARKPVE